MINAHFSSLCRKQYFPNGIPLNNLICDRGNHKVPKTTAIFNMGSATDCPSEKLGLCKASFNGKSFCYAKKAEYLYQKTALPYRRRQEKFWKKTTAENFVFQFLLINANKRNPFNALRFNESGDFWTQECVDKAEIIARNLAKYDIVTYCYTSRSDLDFSRVKKLVICGSGFKKKGITSEFKIINSKKEKPAGYGMCPMNCRICNRCQKRGMKTCVIKH